MRGHNICFRSEIRKIIFELSSILPLNWSSVFSLGMLEVFCVLGMDSSAQLFKGCVTTWLISNWDIVKLNCRELERGLHFTPNKKIAFTATIQMFHAV